MDHRITVAIVAVFGGTLAFTFLVVSLTTSVGPDGAHAGIRLVQGGEVDPAEEPIGPSPREQLVQLVRLLDRRAEQWRRDHGGREPDFATYPAWEQFLTNTTVEGVPRPRGAKTPYLIEPPVNPLNKLSTVIAVDHSLRPADRVPTPPGRVGFVYSRADRCFWGTNGSGRITLVRGAEPAALPQPRVSDAPNASPTTAPTTAPAVP